MPALSRRLFLGSLPFALAARRWARADETGRQAAATFSFGTYGMQSLRTEEAIRAIAEIGYDGVELAVRPEWDAAPANMPATRREQIRGLLAETGLRLTALMEHLYPSRDKGEHHAALERLRQAALLGRDLFPGSPPLIQTTLGGGEWEQVKEMYRDRLADWAEVGRQHATVIAVKPHRGGAMSRPAEAVWLIEQLDRTPWLRMVYDYSHYAHREMPLEATIETALPYTAHIAIKDAVRDCDRVTFELPGQSSTFDYAELFRLLKAGDYRGDVCCEVSGMVSNRPDYAPLAAAKTCYRNIAPSFIAAKLPRPARGS